MDKYLLKDLVRLLTNYKEDNCDKNHLQVMNYMIDILRLNSNDLKYYDDLLRSNKVTEIIDYVTNYSTLLGTMISFITVEYIDNDYKLVITTHNNKQFSIDNIKLIELEDE